MDLADVTTWIHENVATVTIVPRVQNYTSLQATVTTRDGRSGSTPGFGLWGLVEAIAAAIEAWEKAATP